MIFDIAWGQALHTHKGEDTVVVRPIGDGFLLAVADGLSTRNGLAAASWVADRLNLTNATDSIYSLYDNLAEALRKESPSADESETTLSCGLLRVGDRPGTLVFDYFAIGDTPIWKVVRSEDDKYPYQRYLIHGGPYPAESARLYSTISLGDRSITGAVSFGSVVVSESEVLVVCSDGIPEREMLVRDLSSMREKKLCSWLFANSHFTNESLAEVLADYQHRDVFVDDATIIAARLKRSADALESVNTVPAYADSRRTLIPDEEEHQAGMAVGPPETDSEEVLTVNHETLAIPQELAISASFTEPDAHSPALEAPSFAHSHAGDTDAVAPNRQLPALLRGKPRMALPKVGAKSKAAPKQKPPRAKGVGPKKR